MAKNLLPYRSVLPPGKRRQVEAPQLPEKCVGKNSESIDATTTLLATKKSHGKHGDGAGYRD
ncbi:hypothetical protein [Xanthomonas albilineans]|uniref:Uncharacterized protein n=1 Tax=Xanthomonas albilineans (strain GPE PC73 / CFBP 7063) TaxID=380358 RepID=D2UD93_XANAP|nr:hypothetical protein [Xanthomonas albilineans]CBA15874.1 hypothetical protein XALC_1367 [Xanthomonas albilineans GPE PC73]